MQRQRQKHSEEVYIKFFFCSVLLDVKKKRSMKKLKWNNARTAKGMSRDAKI
jgi:hypothetical protein